MASQKQRSKFEADRPGNFRNIRQKLAAWYEANARVLPWRLTADPYAILVSEIMLQQTRVAAVIPYYERFLQQFPTAEQLALASEPTLLSAWSGLGYYSRARNLQKSAKAIAEAGAFPSEHDEIRQLPGVGDYTAAAVGSIAFGLPHAAVDGNVIRVTSRLFAEKGDVGNATVRRGLADLAHQLLDKEHPGRHNQAMMELGATICLPREPLCEVCPVAQSCLAKKLELQRELPVKQKKKELFHVTRRLLLIRKRDKILLWKRPAGSKRMAGFWEMPEAGMLKGVTETELLGEFRHSITNHIYTYNVVSAVVTERNLKLPGEFAWQNRQELELQPLSTTTRKALKVTSLINK
jgi:A/G-specific adenine glycosylase